MSDREAAAAAQALSSWFFRQGNYVYAEQLSGAALSGALPAADAGEAAVEDYVEHAAFAGLAVQSVGYEKGVKNPRVHVYVTSAWKKAEKAAEGIESDVEVRVNKVSRVQVRPEAASATVHRGNVYIRGNRVACGSSCAPSNEKLAGTFGALVKKKGQGQMYVLSNNHVLAAGNHVAVDMPILSPSPMDAGPGIKAPSEIARHSEIWELRSGVPTLVAPVKADVAIARVTDAGAVTSWQGLTDGYDTPTTVGTATSGLRVKKYGRTTGLTHGTLEAFINTPMPVPFRCRSFTATVFFEEVWTIRADPGEPFALAGDSGSLVVDEAAKVALGLVFAESSQGETAYMVPLEYAVQLFDGLRLVGNHGV